MKILKLAFVALFLSIPFLCQSQTKRLDSLLSVWHSTTKSDSIRISSYQEYLNLKYAQKPDSGLLMIKELEEFATQKNEKYGLANAMMYKATLLDKIGRLDESIELNQKAKKIFIELKDSAKLGLIMLNIGASYSTLGNQKEGLYYAKQALDIYKKTKNSQLVVATNNLATIYHKMGDYNSAIKYYQEALELNKKKNNAKMQASLNINLGGLYTDILNDYAKGLQYFEEGLTISRKNNLKSYEGLCLLNMAVNYDKRKLKDKSKTLLNEAIMCFEKVGDEQKLNYCRGLMADHYIAEKEYNKAKVLLDSIMYFAKETDNEGLIMLTNQSYGIICQNQGKLELAKSHFLLAYQLANKLQEFTSQSELSESLYEVYKQLKDYKNALYYFEESKMYYDSLNQNDVAKKMQQLEFDKKLFADSLKQAHEKQELELLHKQEITKQNRIRNTLIGVGLFALLLAGGFFSRWKYVKHTNEIIASEKERSDNLLLNILPAEVAEELKQKGEAEAQDFNEVTVLFTDFVSFTKKSESMTAQDLVSEINYFFKAFDEISTKYNIEKIKTIGDAYMAAGGLPVPSANSAVNTVLAGLEMQQFVLDYQKKQRSEGKELFEMRAGINTGPVVAGIVGIKKFQYDVWGDTVNTASRMETNGVSGKVNISETTYHLIKDDNRFVFEPRGKMDVKGKGMIDMYFVGLA
ncbi:MAG: tetratricopeptide repeat protein [Flavobacteriales bacterium]|nr:tetratricopeptide repeat protein [Flavobacteriales bacterium]